MPFTPTVKNTMLSDTVLGLTTGTVYLSLHTADPQPSGTAELSGGNYARVSGTLQAANNGVRNLSTNVDLTVTANTTITHVGYWDALTGGNFIGSDDVTPETYSNEGTYRVLASGTNFTLADSV